jgi:hypothetical protein
VPRSIEPTLEIDGSEATTVLEYTWNTTREKRKITPVCTDGKAKGTSYGGIVVSGTMTVYVKDSDGPEYDWPTWCTDKSLHAMTEVQDSTHRLKFDEVEYSNLAGGTPRDKGEVVWTMDWVATDWHWV